MRRWPIVVVTWALCAASSSAQTPATGETKPAFEVASVKPSKTSGKANLRAFPGGRTVGTNITLKHLIELAYNVREYQVTGGPKWIDSTEYDIETKPAAAFTPSYETRAYNMKMLQALLEDRFKLAIRQTFRELPVYVLLVGKDGSKLKSRDKPEAPSDMRMTGGRGLIIAQSVPMAIVTESLSEVLGRPVNDATGLKGYYDLRLEWAPVDADADTSPDTAGPSIFTAVQEQLGLKLDAQEGPVEIFVIENAAQPSGN